jgi:hypothetical protein
MQVTLKKIVVAMCLTGLYAQASYAYAISLTDAEFNEKLSSQVSTLQKQLNALKEEIKGKPSVKLAANQPKQYVSHEQRVAKQDNVAKHTQQGVMNRETPHTTSHSLTGHDLVKLIGDSEDYLPFDLDVPGQAFVSTGPYVGVPVQYSGSNLIINSPSVNVDLQLLGIRKGIHAQQKLFGEGALFKEPYHSHLLLSGLVEAQANYTQRTSQKNISNIDVTNVSLDAFFIGPSAWLLGFIEFT